ncbi:MAG TPA: hypothetical protein VNH18_00165, partial [Bryobacteraceae bacterium]|nr:hypothetical protein [Bryobacteraceae bacterium]
RALANTCSQVSGARQMECGKRVIAAAVRATGTADDAANAWYSLAYFSALQRDATATERALRMAISLAPNWFKPHWTLARLLAGTGRAEQAVGEARRAISLDRGKHAEVAESLQAIR